MLYIHSHILKHREFRQVFECIYENSYNIREIAPIYYTTIFLTRNPILFSIDKCAMNFQLSFHQTKTEYHLVSHS